MGDSGIDSGAAESGTHIQTTPWTVAQESYGSLRVEHVGEMKIKEYTKEIRQATATFRLTEGT